MLRIVVDFGIVVKESGGGGRAAFLLTKQVCVTAGGDGAHIHHALRKSAVEAASVACRAQVHHQVRMLSVLHQLSASGQNVCATSAFTLRSKCCLCYISFVVYQSCTVPQSPYPFIIVCHLCQT